MDTTVGNGEEPCKRKRRIFSSEEDNKLKELVAKFGSSNWRLISSYMKGKSQRQCRERYYDYLRSGLRTEPFTKEEDLLLIKNYTEIGPKWSIITKYFEGRSPNSLKNRWHRHLKNRSLYKQYKKKLGKSNGADIESLDTSESTVTEPSPAEDSQVINLESRKVLLPDIFNFLDNAPLNYKFLNIPVVGD